MPISKTRIPHFGNSSIWETIETYKDIDVLTNIDFDKTVSDYHKYLIYTQFDNNDISNGNIYLEINGITSNDYNYVYYRNILRWVRLSKKVNQNKFLLSKIKNMCVADTQYVINNSNNYITVYGNGVCTLAGNNNSMISGFVPAGRINRIRLYTDVNAKGFVVLQGYRG